MSHHVSCFALALMVMCAFAAHRAEPAAQPARAEILSVEKIWDRGPHNAFTDLIWWKDRWHCTFRESAAHVGGDGTLRVISSADGRAWESTALLEEAGVDLRDPKLSVTPDGRLMMVCGGSVYEGKTLKGRQSRVMFSADGREWTAPRKVLESGDWLWRVTWHEGVCYGVSYDSSPAEKGADWKLNLVRSEDGEKFSVVTALKIPGHPNETTLRFLADGRMVALVRREAGDRAGWVGVSGPPYDRWSWKPLGRFVGGPNFIQVPDGRLMAVTREMAAGGARTVLSVLDAERGTLEDLLTLPSGGDTSYAGLAWREGVLWVSYYSSHEGKKTSVYLARVKVGAGEK